MYGPYVSRGRRVLRVVLLLACVLFGTIAAVTGIAIIALVRDALWGVLIAGVGVGLIMFAFRKRNSWHTAEQRLSW